MVSSDDSLGDIRLEERPGSVGTNPGSLGRASQLQSSHSKCGDSGGKQKKAKLGGSDG